MQLTLRHIAAAAVCVAVLVPAAPAAADGPGATASGRCSLTTSEQRGGLGATYVTALSVTRTTCRRGKTIVKAYHACRRRNGGADGRCRGVLGWRCSERRTQRIRTQFDAVATCKKGSATVLHRYTQFT